MKSNSIESIISGYLNSMETEPVNWNEILRLYNLMLGQYQKDVSSPLIESEQQHFNMEDFSIRPSSEDYFGGVYWPDINDLKISTDLADGFVLNGYNAAEDNYLLH